MSQSESRFLKWFGGIAATLLVAAIIGLIGMYSNDNVHAAAIETNKINISRIESTHEVDKAEMNNEHREDMQELKDGQKTMQADIKELLKNF